jgi:hypothetical protein
MLALHLDNLLFLLFIAIVIFFQILTRAAKAGRRSGPTQPRSAAPSERTRPLTEEPADTDEERIRKFLEALGQPTTAEPPPPVAPRPTHQKPVLLPRIPTLSPPLPPLKTRPPDFPREIITPARIPPTRQARTFRPRGVEAPSLEVHRVNAGLQTPPLIEAAGQAYAAATQPSPQVSAKTAGFASLLRSTSSLRDAIILREIFGPPRSLQPLDLVGSV